MLLPAVADCGRKQRGDGLGAQELAGGGGQDSPARFVRGIQSVGLTESPLRGCIDDTIAIAREFPRAHVFDHHKFTSLGFSLRRLIEEVETPWFVYLHSDVRLPEGWFDAMSAAQEKFDWFELRV